MKQPERKKSYRRSLHLAFKGGKINNNSGQLVSQNQIPDSSMKRDHYSTHKNGH